MSVLANGISVRFGGLQALQDVHIEIGQGRVQALIGPNGAGKTTLLNVLSGFVQPTAGLISVNGKDVTREPSHKRAWGGVARSFQTPRFVPHATVRENVLAGFYPHAKSKIVSTMLGLPRQRREEKDMQRKTEELISRFGLEEVADERAADVPLWRLRVMEIARCMTISPRYVFLDEPAAGSDENERRMLAQHVRSLRDSGVGVLIVEHNFGFIKSVCESVTVLAQGQLLASGAPEAIEEDPRVVEVYLGKEES
ncbi:ABC transporter ATP-binding protein [Specibacter sp. RAF43]|uniref:ABC transporter ATP-binding protein n=1 Tax=Specibacter sp. RAF43 TaxID=3233057 RepID=UPI003F9CB2BD